MKPRRVDQVNELTRGLTLPMTPIAIVHLHVILDAMKRALDQLIVEYGDALATKEEKELNSLVQARLNKLCAEEKLLSQMVVCVVRGGESVSFDGKRLELRPDLGIYLTGRNRSFPLVVECKIIDRAGGKGVDLYCVHGVQRFVEGDYAWGSTQGVMLGYVRDGSSVSKALTPHLRASAVKRVDPFRTQGLPDRKKAVSLTIWTSRHSRDFSYVGEIGGQPGPIGISHLWVSIPNMRKAAPRLGRTAVPRRR
ncbi:hypothetical protein HAP47_0025120 [Bradyrhizobium sp. 41S5]|uniref:hypothetical protein n=1 Tax=Bradyrhizobium sp. 41S5 TaxID=1404443 RepID=UPI00156BC628|nr:hypothetical protein [Bradyrhizobium sp. 41S5]UFX42518.1 hypothetical protein HAP47_0025120 [Bradyrhizobium sp. 41S5]